MHWANDLNLIVGAGGFIGGNLEEYFRQRAIPFVSIARKDADLRDRDAVMAVFASLPKAGRIFHLATFQRTGQRQYEIPATLFDTNMRIHINILEAWATHQPQAKLISTGSSCAYPESEEPIGESRWQSGPLHESVRAYGLAKQALARGSEVYGAQFGLKWLHCILATVYGPHDHLEADRSHFVGGMMVRAVKGLRDAKKDFSVWGSGGAVRECLYVEDQIEAILAADAKFENRILNCAANAPVTIANVAEAIMRVLGWEATIIYPEGTFAGASHKVLNSSLFLERTGWCPRFGLDEGLRRLAIDLKQRA